MSARLNHLLALSQAAQSENQKATAQRKIARAVEAVDTVARTCPDDREDLREEQADWMKEWDLVMVRDCLSPAFGADRSIERPP